MNITINGKPIVTEESVLTYERIVDLADTQWGKTALHSITYSHMVPFTELPGERSGMVAPGKSVPVSAGMTICAVVTGYA